MLLHPTLDQLDAMGLTGMATALREQLEAPTYQALAFEERLGLLVDREARWRENRRLTTRLKAARLRQPATVEDLDFRAPRGLDRGVILRLAQAEWVTAHHNVLLTGATGCGKSYLACALAQAAIRQGHTARYVRVPRLLDDLALGRGDGRYATLLEQLRRTALLVLDDFLLTPVTVAQARDLLEVIEDRAELRSTLVASQLPVEAWHDALADATLADAILDRLVHNGHRLRLSGPSLRRREPAAIPVAGEAAGPPSARPAPPASERAGSPATPPSRTAAPGRVRPS